MKMAKRWQLPLFVGGILLAGALHVLDRLCNTYLADLGTAAGSALPAFSSTLLFVLNLAIYCALLLWWTQSVYTRLLPSTARRLRFSAGYGMMQIIKTTGGSL